MRYVKQAQQMDAEDASVKNTVSAILSDIKLRGEVAVREVIVADDMEEAIAVCSAYAIEHLHVHAAQPRSLMEQLTNYGSLFLGAGSSVVFSDKLSGTNHTLPTRTAARYTGGLWVGTYLKVVTHQEVSGSGMDVLARHASRQSQIEGLVGHAMSAAARLSGATI